jgi:hypothetical protein
MFSLLHNTDTYYQKQKTCACMILHHASSQSVLKREAIKSGYGIIETSYHLQTNNATASRNSQLPQREETPTEKVNI